MDETLKHRLFVPCDVEQRLQDARGVRVEAHDLADAGAILEVHPPGVLEPGDQPPGERANRRRFIRGLWIGCGQ